MEVCSEACRVFFSSLICSVIVEIFQIFSLTVFILFNIQHVYNFCCGILGASINQYILITALLLCVVGDKNKETQTGPRG